MLDAAEVVAVVKVVVDIVAVIFGSKGVIFEVVVVIFCVVMVNLEVVVVILDVVVVNLDVTAAVVFLFTFIIGSVGFGFFVDIGLCTTVLKLISVTGISTLFLLVTKGNVVVVVDCVTCFCGALTGAGVDVVMTVVDNVASVF